MFAWNTFGLADFAVAVATGALAGSGALLQNYGSVPNDAMEAFPLAIIPGFLVLLFVITHPIVYFQLRVHWRNRESIQLDR